MKMLIVLGVLAIVFTSCGTLISPETRYERENLIAAYDAAREKHNPERVKEAVKDLLVGKWQYVGLEVEKGLLPRSGQTPRRYRQSTHPLLLRRWFLKAQQANRQQPPTRLDKRDRKTLRIQKRTYRPQRRM